MQVTIKISMDNSAFMDDENELPRILEKLALELRQRCVHFGSIVLRDINGNSVGRAEFGV